MPGGSQEKPDRLRIAIIDNSLDPAVYRPVDHWRQFLPDGWESFRAVDGHLPDLGLGFTHVLLTGSEASIVEREAWVEAEVELVREALSRGLPLLGSCYGHQLLVLALKGPAHVRRCHEPEVGWIPLRIRRANRLLGRAGIAYSFSVHFDEVVDPGEDFSVLASTAACPIQAIKLKGKPVWGIQFHPEIDILSARNLLGQLLSLGSKHVALFARALESRPRDSGLIHRIIGHFLSARAKK